MRKVGNRIVADLSYTNWWGPVEYYLYDSYDMDTFNHRGWYKASAGDIGGPFFLVKNGWKGVTPLIFTWPGAAGPHAPIGDAFNPEYTDPGTPSNSWMDAKGTTAIARTAPTNPSFNLAQAIGEMREGFPKMVLSGLMKKKTKKALNAGDEYLNVEFGWKPLINDIKKLATTIKNSEQIVENYRRGSDQKIARRYEYPPSNTTAQAQGSGYGMFFSGGYQVDGKATVLASTKSATWFEGCFRYHVPVPDSTLGRLKEHASLANKLLGVKLTPELVWNLTPWSWMADWFGNTGDVLKNISSLGQDGLVMQYGYVMSSSEGTYTRNHWTPEGVFSSSTSYFARRKRLPATPFGFGVDLNALTSKQIAITAALGLSKGGRAWNEQK